MRMRQVLTVEADAGYRKADAGGILTLQAVIRQMAGNRSMECGISLTVPDICLLARRR